MSRERYSDDQLHFLAETFKEESLADTTSMFNFVYATDKSVSEIKSCLKNHGITCGRPRGAIKKGLPLSLTIAQKEWITKKYQDHQIKDLTALFNAEFNETKTVNQLRAFVKNHGIKSGRTGHFPAGVAPWNSGMKGWSAGGRSEVTRFKAGHIPVNHRPVGSERINVDGYIEVKVAEPNAWRLKHRVVWAECRGDIPRGHVVWFRDNNPLNCDIHNLMLVTRQQHAVVNKLGLQQAPAEMKETAKLIADVSMARRQRQSDQKRKRA